MEPEPTPHRPEGTRLWAEAFTGACRFAPRLEYNVADSRVFPPAGASGGHGVATSRWGGTLSLQGQPPRPRCTHTPPFTPVTWPD